MKFTAICLVMFFAAVYSAPTQIQDNNVGDIITVGKIDKKNSIIQ